MIRVITTLFTVLSCKICGGAGLLVDTPVADVVERSMFNNRNEYKRTHMRIPPPMSSSPSSSPSPSSVVSDEVPTSVTNPTSLAVVVYRRPIVLATPQVLTPAKSLISLSTEDELSRKLATFLRTRAIRPSRLLVPAPASWGGTIPFKVLVSVMFRLANTGLPPIVKSAAVSSLVKIAALPPIVKVAPPPASRHTDVIAATPSQKSIAAPSAAPPRLLLLAPPTPSLSHSGSSSAGESGPSTPVLVAAKPAGE